MIRKKRYRILLVFLTLGLVILLVLQLKAKQLVENFLDKKIPAHIDLAYSDMDVNILTGTVGFKKVAVALSNRDTTSKHTDIVTDKLTISGLGYFKFFFKNTISADEILIENPDLTYYHYLKLPSKDTVRKGVVNLLKTIAVDKITIEQGKFTMYSNTMDSVKVKVERIDFNLYNAKIDPKIIQRKIPVEYDDYLLEADSIFVDLGPFEHITLGHLEFVNRNIRIQAIALDSKYDKHALSAALDTERDFISLAVPEVGIDGIDFGFRSNRFFITAMHTTISMPDLLLYRDKLVTDDKTHKALYASSLRELPIDLEIDSVQVNHGQFVYEERVTKDDMPGKLIFEDLNMTIGRLGNLGKAKQVTTVNSTSLFMGSSPLELSWQFDVANEHDAFLASGDLRNFKSANSNSFLRPSLNMEAEGEIAQLYFTISGDAIHSSGDLKMKYADFKFDILGKDGKKVNKFWTAIGNIFVNDGSKTDSDGFRHGKITVTRDPTKSFFNYLWLNIKEGLINTLTGDGKKE